MHKCGLSQAQNLIDYQRHGELREFLNAPLTTTVGVLCFLVKRVEKGFKKQLCLDFLLICISKEYSLLVELSTLDLVTYHLHNLLIINISGLV